MLRKSISIKFLVEGQAAAHSNINFARAAAQDIANAELRTVKIVQMVNGNKGLVIQCMDPCKELLH